MNEQQAKDILIHTFTNPFDTNNFIHFIKELFNNFDYSRKEASQEEISREFSDFIDSYSLFGRYEDPKSKTIEILAVKLKNNNPDSARTMQRNFIAKYLEQRNSDAALVAFYGEDIDNWRLSFVKVEYHIETNEKGNVKPNTMLTPPKRYSFLVGKTEPSHTAQRMFLELLEREDLNITILDIEESFSVEKVTKEFFESYKKLFLELEESLSKIVQQNETLAKEFNEKGISTTEFAKKLLGQIVFIYFLQRKGWLGIEKDETGKFKEWGTGNKNFLKKLYNKDIVGYNNFFNDILEPLFYEALAIDRENDYYSRFKCKVPFLNGGLFEPLGGYNWTDTDIPIDNTIFGEILDTFDLYNFTVKEDEPLEKEVAIDPEMLGKVFENLLEVKDRKSKGSYYTPREIVYYMCQQSLINYLENGTGIQKNFIDDFIYNGIISGQIKNNKDTIDSLLKDIKVVDPAIGSGAFPVGMMMEIIKSRAALTELFPEEKQDERTVYNFKRECIEESLYGVDIDPGAVDIAQLRLWLSLVVDESDMHKIKPLPNLDYKIMCGNSLLDEFEGIKLFDERLLGEPKKDNHLEIESIEGVLAKLYQEFGEIQTGKKKDNGRSKEIWKEIKKLERKKRALLAGPKKEGKNSTLDEKVNESQRKLNEIKGLHKDFFSENNRKNKIKLRKDIEKLDWEFIEEALKEQENEEARIKLVQIKKNRSKPFFLWKLYFSEVFQEKGGFDVIIGNPPYVENKKIGKEIKQAYKEKFKSAIKLFDLSILFIELAKGLACKNGFITFITTNKFLASDYGIKIRSLLLNETMMQKLVDVSYINVFKEARAFPVIIGYLNNVSEENKIDVYPRIDNVKRFENGLDDFKQIVNQKDYRCTEDMIFYISPNIEIALKMAKQQNVVKLGLLNPQFIYRPLGFTNWGDKLKNITDKPTVNSLKFISTPNIQKYVVNWGKKINVNKITIKKAYMSFENDDKEVWNNLTKENLLIKEVALKLTVAYTKGEYAHITGIYGLRINGVNMKYILALLNSKLMNFYYTSYYGLIHLTGGYLKINSSYLKNLPIKKIPENNQNIFSNIVNKILFITDNDDYSKNSNKQAFVKTLETQVDKMVYDIYGLSKEEIEIVESAYDKIV